MLDILIKNGVIVDGTGKPAFKADVGVAEGRIAVVAKSVGQETVHTIEAQGFHIAPGFIDPHTHSDVTLLVNPQTESKIRQGVTTEVIGNCGDSPAPLSSAAVEEMRSITIGLVGESGCGKTTIGKNLLLLQRPTAGKVYFDGQYLVQLDQLDKKQLRLLRRRLGIVYQNPHSSLNPRMTVANIVGRPLAIQRGGGSGGRVERVATMMEKVGLNPEHLGRYPHEFSGGQKQRIAVARALITNPDFVVLDEPTSALDVSVQAQILKLLRVLQDELNLTYLFISHDISVIRYMSDMVTVMYVGKLVEHAGKRQIFDNPLHPYTQALLSVVPIPDPKQRRRERKILSGDVPSPKNPPPGCRFHPRCDHALPECKVHEPPLIDIDDGHYVACHRYLPR